MSDTTGFAPVPHVVLYLRAEVKDLLTRVRQLGNLDLGFGRDMYESFVRYQTRLIRVFDRLAVPYGFTTVDASRSADHVFEALKAQISGVFRRHTDASNGSRASAVRRKRGR